MQTSIIFTVLFFGLFSLMDAAKEDEDDSSDSELLVPRRRTPLEQVGDKLERSCSETTATTQIYDLDPTFGIVKSGLDFEMFTHFLQDNNGDNLGFEKKTFSNQGIHRTKCTVLYNMDNSKIYY